MVVPCLSALTDNLQADPTFKPLQSLSVSTDDTAIDAETGSESGRAVGDNLPSTVILTRIGNIDDIPRDSRSRTGISVGFFGLGCISSRNPSIDMAHICG